MQRPIRWTVGLGCLAGLVALGSIIVGIVSCGIATAPTPSSFRPLTSADAASLMMPSSRIPQERRAEKAASCTGIFLAFARPLAIGGMDMSAILSSRTQ